MDGWTDGCHECHNATELCRRREAIVAVLPFSPCFRPNFIHQSIMPSLSTFTPLIPCPPLHTSQPIPLLPLPLSRNFHLPFFIHLFITYNHPNPPHHCNHISSSFSSSPSTSYSHPIPSHFAFHPPINSSPTFRLQYLSFLHLITFILVYPTLLYPTLFYSILLFIVLFLYHHRKVHLIL